MDINPINLVDPSTTEVKPKNRGGRPKGSLTRPELLKKKRVESVVSLAARGLPATHISAILNVPESTVRYDISAFKSVFRNLVDVDSYRAHRVRLLEAAEFTLLQSMMNEEKLAKASVNNLAYAYAQLHTARRLEQGASTSNVAHLHRYVAALSDVTPLET